MKYNPKIHKRKSIRLKGYDYSQAGLYFITICCERRGNPSRLPFGQIDKNEMILNENGIIAYNEWGKLAERFQNFEIDVFQIMPNHMHGIIVLNDTVSVGAGFTPAQNDANTQNANTQNANTQNANTQNANEKGQPQGIAHTISDIVGAYKSLVNNECLEIYKSNCVRAGLAPARFGKLWQRNYYEHIIRNEQSYQTISNYIINNPAKWQEDKFYQYERMENI
jgi:putative transposase